ncbi:MAG: DHH family phosphoesterase [Acutalibacteraceae bacterium]
MRLKDFLRELTVEIAAFIAAAVFIIVIAVRYSRWAALAGTVLLAVFSAFKIIKFFNVRNRERQIKDMVSQGIDPTDANSVNDFPLPLLVCDSDGIIELFNRSFYHTFMDESVIDRKLAQPFIGGCTPAQAAANGPAVVKINDSYYTVTPSTFEFKGGDEYVFYFTDVSEMRRAQLAYIKNRPVIMLLQTDDISDIKADYKDSERAAIRSGIEGVIENWTGEYNCIMRKISEERFMVIAQSDELEKMRADRFSVLDKIREYKYKDRVLGVTLSIGVGTGTVITDCEESAEQALDMALGRGGDQAAVKTKDEYEFFGGVSKSVEKVTKFQTRVAASSLSSLISASDRVLIMGHAFPDMDAFGAAVGVSSVTRALGVEPFIVLDEDRSFSNAALNMLREDNWDGRVINENEALAMITRKTLLVVVDTHKSNFVDFPSLYEKASAVVVIDHHRKSVDHITDALIFFHDPNASSTCEMVTELMRYITPSPTLSPAEAQAMLAGIMLDTKEFVLSTGVRTFEAAAFLKGKGADTVAVKRLFASSIESNRKRSEIISAAQIYRGCAVACTASGTENARLLSSQAADELLEVSGVKASFVIFDSGRDTVNISARSYGDMNVQIIMEYLGGGGHRTMAAAQLTGVDTEQAKARLYEAIDAKYPEDQ